jgi:hypothetical protein
MLNSCIPCVLHVHFLLPLYWLIGNHRCNWTKFVIILSVILSYIINLSKAGADPGGGGPGAPPSLKLEKIRFFGVKSWFFTRNTRNIFAPPSTRRNFFKCAPPLNWNPGSAPVRGRCGRDRMVVGFTTTYAISAYHHWCCSNLDQDEVYNIMW